MGFEPMMSAWKAEALPLGDTRMPIDYTSLNEVGQVVHQKAVY